MKELLMKLLTDYLSQTKEIENKAVALMKAGKEWKHLIQETNTLQIMIEETLYKIDKNEKRRTDYNTYL